MNWYDFIKPELLVLIPFYYIVYDYLKKTPILKWVLPILLWGVSMIFTMLYLVYLCGHGFSFEVIISGIIQGTFLSFVPTSGNHLISYFGLNNQGAQNGAAPENKETEDKSIEDKDKK